MAIHGETEDGSELLKLVWPRSIKGVGSAYGGHANGVDGTMMFWCSWLGHVHGWGYVRVAVAAGGQGGEAMLVRAREGSTGMQAMLRLCTEVGPWLRLCVLGLGWREDARSRCRGGGAPATLLCEQGRSAALGGGLGCCLRMLGRPWGKVEKAMAHGCCGVWRRMPWMVELLTP